jgi:hypothetical protein
LLTDEFLDLGKIRIDEPDRSVYVSAFRVIARVDPELFAKMTNTDWHILSCQASTESGQRCLSTLDAGATGETVMKFNGSPEDATWLLFDIVDREIADYAPNATRAEFIATLLVHEFCHLFENAGGTGELEPQKRAYEFTKKLGVSELIAYHEILCKKVVNNHWDTYGGIHVVNIDDLIGRYDDEYHHLAGDDYDNYFDDDEFDDNSDEDY